jgi:uncharacterized protein (TIGR02246 family)
MRNDEQAIRDFLSAWHAATVSGNVTKLLTLMDEDVVFLLPGRSPMRGRDAFASSFREVTKHKRIDYTWETEEIQVKGDWAYCWNHLWLMETALDDSPPLRRSGFTLTILRKNAKGDWLLYRDANLLTPEND